MSKLVDHRIPNLMSRLGAGVRDAEDRAAKDRDLIGKRRRDAEDAEELIIVVDEIEIVGARLFFDDDGDVLDQLRESIGQLVECLFDELPEFVR